jgi:hypothetical protein
VNKQTVSSRRASNERPYRFVTFTKFSNTLFVTTNEKIKNSENFLAFVTQLSILVWYNKEAADVNGKHRPIKQLIRFFHLIHFSSLLIKYENGQSFFDCLFSLRRRATLHLLKNQTLLQQK